MMKTLGALGVLGTASALSICNICTTGSPHSIASLVSVAQAAPLAAHPTPVVTSIVDTTTVTFRVDGMTCGGCVIGVRKVLTRLDGVKKADVSYQQQRAVVTYDRAKVTVEQMIAAIKTLGYKATVVTT
jgi:mercuric ion binding protein